MNHSEWIAHYFGRPVIKAFNNITDISLKGNAFKNESVNRIALPVAGDSFESKLIICKLIEEIGFDSVDAGTLNESWKLQMGGPMYCNDLNKEELQVALKIADRSVLENQYLEIFQQLFEYSNEYVKNHDLDVSNSNSVLVTMEKGDAETYAGMVKIFRSSFENLLHKHQ